MTGLLRPGVRLPAHHTSKPDIGLREDYALNRASHWAARSTYRFAVPRHPAARVNPGRPQPYHAPIACHGGAAVSPMVFDLMPAACSSVPPLDGSQQASHRTALSGIV